MQSRDFISRFRRPRNYAQGGTDILLIESFVTRAHINKSLEAPEAIRPLCEPSRLLQLEQWKTSAVFLV